MKDVVKNIRKNVLKMAHYSHASHVGSALSSVDIIATLYFKIMNICAENLKSKNRDKFILSKAHASTALYATLAEKGFISQESLFKYYIDDGVLTGHLDNQSVCGVDCSAGSLGHGLSVGIGMALANAANNVYVLMGDGECNEGSVWEAFMLLGKLKLRNITAIIDKNKLQGFGFNKEIIDQDNLLSSITSFGLDVFEVNGHEIAALEGAFKACSERTKVIIANTIKGKGVSFMENKLEWHYKSPNDIQLIEALKEIENS